MDWTVVFTILRTAVWRPINIEGVILCLYVSYSFLTPMETPGRIILGAASNLGTGVLQRQEGKTTMSENL
jgi:hypothetical protein